MHQEGIEIHFDEKCGHLQLACEPDAFAAYLAVAREHLKHFPDIPIDTVIELNVLDTATYIARRDAPKRRLGGLLFGIIVTIILALAIIGANTLITRIFV